jgi:hypothetical protein
MLMGNASKILQTVCANIDRDVAGPNLENLFDLVLLTDTTGILTGEEDVVPKGVVVAMQKETQRQRQIEFLQITANPVDLQIIGPNGRAKVLRSVSQTIGLDGEDIVPDDHQMQEQQEHAQALAQQGGVPGHQMGPPGPGGGAPPPQGAPGPGAAAQGNPAPRTGQGGPQTALFIQRPQAGPMSSQNG